MWKNLGAKRKEGGGRGLDKGGPAQERSEAADHAPTSGRRPLVTPDWATAGWSTVARSVTAGRSIARRPTAAACLDRAWHFF
jgi:hypothetical protein